MNFWSNEYRHLFLSTVAIVLLWAVPYHLIVIALTTAVVSYFTISYFTFFKKDLMNLWDTYFAEGEIVESTVRQQPEGGQDGTTASSKGHSRDRHNRNGREQKGSSLDTSGDQPAS